MTIKEQFQDFIRIDGRTLQGCDSERIRCEFGDVHEIEITAKDARLWLLSAGWWFDTNRGGWFPARGLLQSEVADFQRECGE